MPCSVITVRTSWKSTFTRPGWLMISAIPRTALFSTSSAASNASSCVTSSPSTSSSLSFRITISESTVRHQLLNALFGDLHALGAFPGERLGDHRHGEDAQRTGHLGDDRTCAVPVPPPMPAVMNTMCEPRQRFFQALAVGERHGARFLGFGARPQPAGAELDLIARLAAGKHLRVRCSQRRTRLLPRPARSCDRRRCRLRHRRRSP